MADLDKQILKGGAAPITSGDVEFSTTGLLGLDWALGGGIARGRIIEFFGLESSGKSTIGLQSAIAEVHRTGVPALWFDYEYAWDPEYVIGLGATEDGSKSSGTAEFALAQPESIEKGFDLAVGMAGDVSSIWFDSTGVMVSEQAGVASMTNARAMAQGLPRLIRVVAGAQVVCGFISQTRDVIQTGFGGGWSQGPKRKATGGGAIKFAFSQRVEFAHKAKLKGRSEEITGAAADGIIGRRVVAKVVKNKVGVPWRVMEFDLVDGVGFDRIRHLIELGVATGVVGKKGAYFEVPGIPKAVQGLQTLSELLRDLRAVNVVDALEGAVTMKLETAGGVDVGTANHEEVSDDGGTADEE